MSILRTARIIGFAGLLTACSLAGCGGGGGGTVTGDTTAPTISDTSATSAKSNAGGDITISATVTDAVGVSSVTAVVTRPDGTNTVALTMSPGANNVYTYTYSAAANDGYAAETYTVVVTARDAVGNTATSSQFTFQVPGETPPPAPVFD